MRAKNPLLTTPHRRSPEGLPHPPGVAEPGVVVAARGNMRGDDRASLRGRRKPPGQEGVGGRRRVRRVAPVEVFGADPREVEGLVDTDGAGGAAVSVAANRLARENVPPASGEAWPAVDADRRDDDAGADEQRVYVPLELDPEQDRLSRRADRPDVARAAPATVREDGVVRRHAAAGGNVEPYWPMLFSKMIATVSIRAPIGSQSE